MRSAVLSRTGLAPVGCAGVTAPVVRLSLRGRWCARSTTRQISSNIVVSESELALLTAWLMDSPVATKCVVTCRAPKTGEV